MKVGFLPLLALLFIGLKLTNVITWSWFWVLSPLWIAIVIPTAFFLGAMIVYIGLISGWWD